MGRTNAWRAAPCLVTALSLAACGAASDGSSPLDDEGLEDALTSNTALSRELKFRGMVYVREGASDSEILQAVRRQTQSAFGALRTAEMGVNSRELKDVDPKTFTKTKVDVVDPLAPAAAATPMLRVSYTYTDMAVVPKSFARRTAIGLGLLQGAYSTQSDRILAECTDNDAHAREFAGSIWYVFNPSLSGCRTAMTKEQQKVDADRAKVGSSKVPKSEVDRLYRPITVRLGSDKTNKGTSYPEYDKLFAGGVKADTLVIGLVGGMLDHDHKSYAEDSGYNEWMTTLREIFEARKGFELKKVEPAVDTTTVTVGGKTYTGITFQNVMSWTLDRTGYPAGSTYQEQTEIRKAMGDKLAGRWLTFSAPIRVTNEAGSKDATVEIYTYFGAGSDSAPHKQAIKNSDVFIYNGHSYIGYGPLDPSRYSAADFPNSYQILFIDGCVSYNYYEKDFFPLKSEGTKTLDMITNGLEAPSWQSGYALGRFLARLVDGSLPSYRELLDAAEATDALRVVDGEVDNTFNPTKKRLVVADR